MARIYGNLGRPLEIEEVAEFEANVEVDDANEPADENILDEQATKRPECTYRAWGHDGMCPRRSGGIVDLQPSLQVNDD
jgi:hypothetical protein